MLEENKKTSIYAKKNGKSLSDSLKNYNKENFDQISTEFINYLEAYDPAKINIFDIANAEQVVANAAILFRFKVEIMEVLNQNREESKERQQELINKLLGKDSKYKELYDKYYEPTNGLVERMQKPFRDLGIEPLFNPLLETYQPETDVSLGAVEQSFTNIKRVREILKLENYDHKSYTFATAKLSGENAESVATGLVLSDPRITGTMLAFMGDKSKEGAIDLVEGKSKSFGKNTAKAVFVDSARRCLFVIGILALFVATGAFLAPALVAAIGIPVTYSAATAGVITAVVGGIIGLGAIGHIEKTVKKEAIDTAEHESPSVNADFGNLGISANNVTKYLMAPIYRGQSADTAASLKNDFEKQFNKIGYRVKCNTKAIHNIKDPKKRENIKKLSEGLNAFGIHYAKKKSVEQIK